MKKLIKILVLGFVIVAVLVTGALFAAKLYFTPEKIRTLSLAAAKKYLNREVHIGKIGMGMGSAAITDFEISKYPDFSKGKAFSVKELSGGVRILSLLKLKIGLQFSAKDGYIEVRKYKDGKFSFENMLKEDALAPEEKKTDEKPSSFGFLADRVEISSLSLENIGVKYNDEQLKMQVLISDFNADARAVSLNGRFPLAFSFKTVYPFNGVNADIFADFKGKINLANLDMAKGELYIDKMSVKTGKMYKEVSGQITNFTAPSLDLSAKIASFNTKEIRPYFKQLAYDIQIPETNAEISAKITETTAKISKLKIKSGKFTASADGSAEIAPKIAYNLNFSAQGSMPKTDLAQFGFKGYTIPDSEIDIKADASDTRVKIDKFNLSAGKSKLSASGVLMQDKKGYKLKSSIKDALADLDEISALSPALKECGNPGGKISAKLDLNYENNTPSWKGTAKLADVSGGFEGNSLKSLNADIKFEGNKINAPKISGQFNGAPFSGSLSVSALKEKIKTAFNINFEELKLKSMLAGTTKSAPAKPAKSAGKPLYYFDINADITAKKITHPNFTGKNAKFNCALVNLTPEMKNVSGKSSFSVVNGRLAELGGLVKENKMAAVALMPLSVLQKAGKLVGVKLLPDFNNIDYKIIDGSYRFNNGLMTAEKTRLLAELADANVVGTANFRTDALNMDASVLAKGGVQNVLSKPVKFHIGGTISNPKTTVNVISVAGSLGNSVKKGGESLLKSIFK